MLSFWSVQLLLQDGLSPPPTHTILDLVRGSGVVVQAILYILVLFSVGSWGIIAQKFRQIRRAKIEWPNHGRIALWVAPNIEYFHYNMPIRGSGSSHWPDVQIGRAHV